MSECVSSAAHSASTVFMGKTISDIIYIQLSNYPISTKISLVPLRCIFFQIFFFHASCKMLNVRDAAVGFRCVFELRPLPAGGLDGSWSSAPR